jgi:hypothetical protein
LPPVEDGVDPEAYRLKPFAHWISCSPELA